MIFQIADHTVEFQQHHLLQRVGADIVGFVAGPPVAPVVGTVEIFNGTVDVVEIVVQLVAAVSAVQQIGEHILLGFLGFPALRSITEFLHLFPCGGVNDDLVVVFKNGPVFFGVDQTAFVLKGFGICFEVDQSAGVLPERQNFGDRGFTPFARCILALFTALADALAFPMLRWGQDTVLLQQSSCSFDPVPFYTKPVNPADYLGSFIVNDPLSRIVRVLFVVVRR